VVVLCSILGACTSIVAADVDGTVWHGRNLDYEMNDLLTHTTFLAKFTRNGTVRGGM
jgi:penicillin V acylase-like amidase (Ntn superfamily)